MSISKQNIVLISSTVAFTVCFMVWMMFAVLGIPIQESLGLNNTQFGLLAATPVLTGSLIRLPLGMMTDKYGGRIVYFVLMIATVVPIFLMSYATEYWQFLFLGLFVGLAGGSFSVGIAYVAKWFEADKQGFAMVVFGAGNAGSALTKMIGPSIIMRRKAGDFSLKFMRGLCSLQQLAFGFLATKTKPTKPQVTSAWQVSLLS